MEDFLPKYNIGGNMEEYINRKGSEAKEFLLKKAKDKKATYYSEVMEEIHTSRRWIGSILIQVASLCHENNEPILSSLVEHKKKNGGIGEGYEYVVTHFGARQNYKEEQKKCFLHWENR